MIAGPVGRDEKSFKPVRIEAINTDLTQEATTKAEESKPTTGETETSKPTTTEMETTKPTTAEETTKPTTEEETTKPTTAEETTKPTTVEEETSKPTTVEKVAITEKRKVPVMCDITNADAVSAINRASTVDCKNLIRNITCLAQEGKLYNLDMPNLCPLGSNPGMPVESLTFSKDNNPVRILFLLSLHGRSARQVKRLFKAIYHSDHYYYVHVDSVSHCVSSIVLYFN